MPAHNHIGGSAMIYANGRFGTTVSGGATNRASQNGTNNKYDYTSTTGSGGSHSHAMSGSATFTGSATENRPQYYALAYIMKS
jgi:hypothetical protein